MGLDLYSGSLARYHSGDWELMAHRVAREAGMDILVVRPEGTGPSDAVAPAEVLSWRQGILEQCSNVIKEGWRWEENPSAPYWTDKPDHDGRDALILAAAYAEYPNIQTPLSIPSDLGADPAYVEASKAYFQSAISILECHMFIPSQEDFLTAAPDAVGVERFITSTSNLAWALELVNAAHWHADEAQIEGWLQRGPITSDVGALEGGDLAINEVTLPADAFMHSAQFGFAVYRAGLNYSRAHNVPIVTDE